MHSPPCKQNKQESWELHVHQGYASWLQFRCCSGCRCCYCCVYLLENYKEFSQMNCHIKQNTEVVVLFHWVSKFCDCWICDLVWSGLVATGLMGMDAIICLVWRHEGKCQCNISLQRNGNADMLTTIKNEFKFGGKNRKANLKMLLLKTLPLYYPIWGFGYFTCIYFKCLVHTFKSFKSIRFVLITRRLEVCTKFAS